jgi:PPOX class probable FMN-dependent enzyme
VVDEHAITSLEQLRDVYPAAKQRSLDKQIDHLDEHCRRFISLSPFAVLCSSAADGRCDASPKGGPPGFARVLDRDRLLMPDATGNRRLDGFQNMLENPRVGIVFMIPGMGETLRINGRVELTRDPALLGGLETGGRPAELALIVHAEEVYIHCAKALIRSRLWDPATWPEELPSAAEILSDHIGIGDVEASAAALAESYETRL